MYFLDGYNLLFTCFHSNHPLSSQRDAFIKWLQERFSSRRIQGALIFDGDRNRKGESGRTYSSPLEIIYTSHHESADAYILEKLEGNARRSEITVVTNDRHLSRGVRALGTKTLKNEAFLAWLQEKALNPPDEKPNFKETDRHFQRLLKLWTTDDP